MRCDDWSLVALFSNIALRCGQKYGGDTDACDRELMFRRALEVKPDWNQLRRNLAYFLEQQDRISEASVLLSQANDSGSILAKASLCPPHTFTYTEPRLRYHALISSMNQAQKALYYSSQTEEKEDALNLLASMPIAWPYLGYDVQPLMRKFGQILKRISSSSSSSSRIRKVYSPTRLLRLVIVTELRQNTSPGLLFEHILLHFCSRKERDTEDFKFEIIFVAPKDLETDFIQLARRTCPNVVDLPTTSTLEASNTLLELNAHVILYLALGLSLLTYTTAMSRLAPIQVSFGHGHPISSGLSTIDFFVSSSLFFHAHSLAESDSVQHYIEQEVLFDTPTSAFTRPNTLRLDRNGALRLFSTEIQINIEQNAPFFVCLQHSKKLHPNFDFVLKAVLEAVPDAYIALLQGASKHLARWHKAKLDTSRLLFLPRAPRHAILALTATADAFLDTYPWGGGVTVLAALAVCTPVIVLPRETSVLQLAQAYLTVSDLSDFLLAHNVSHYASIAARLAKDPVFRSAIRRRACNSAPLLYPLYSNNRGGIDSGANTSLIISRVIPRMGLIFTRIHRMLIYL